MRYAVNEDGIYAFQFCSDKLTEASSVIRRQCRSTLDIAKHNREKLGPNVNEIIRSLLVADNLLTDVRNIAEKVYQISLAYQEVVFFSFSIGKSNA